MKMRAVYIAVPVLPTLFGYWLWLKRSARSGYNRRPVRLDRPVLRSAAHRLFDSLVFLGLGLRENGPVQRGRDSAGQSGRAGQPAPLPVAVSPCGRREAQSFSERIFPNVLHCGNTPGRACQLAAKAGI